MTDAPPPPTSPNPGTSDSQVSRRSVLRSLAATAGALAAAPWMTEAVWRDALALRAQAATAAAAGPLPHFFDAREREAVQVLTEVIIPADGHSPGAAEAGVTEFIDYMLTGAPADTQTRWREGLGALDRASRELGGRPFAQLSEAQRLELVTTMSRAEQDPRTPLDRLFVEAKASTILGYYTSEVGIHRELGYKGNQYLDEFQGCTHPEHQA